MRSRISLYAITEAETAALKTYLSLTFTQAETFPIERVNSYLWVELDLVTNVVTSWQHIVGYSGDELKKLVKNYYTSTNDNIPFSVYKNPDKYPEYFL